MCIRDSNKPEQVKHIAMLEEMNKKGDFSYVGRKDESTEKFYNCLLYTSVKAVVFAGKRQTVPGAKVFQLDPALPAAGVAALHTGCLLYTSS